MTSYCWCHHSGSGVGGTGRYRTDPVVPIIVLMSHCSSGDVILWGVVVTSYCWCHHSGSGVGGTGRYRTDPVVPVIVLMSHWSSGDVILWGGGGDVILLVPPQRFRCRRDSRSIPY